MIDSFTGRNRFLSNFFIADTKYDTFIYPSSEHAYQAAKSQNNKIRGLFLDRNMTPGQAKKLGFKIARRPDWETVKLSIMKEVVLDKFTRNSTLKEKLLATGDQQLVEGNTWDDKFWGVCGGEGLNHLGLILMEVRTELGIAS